MSKEDKKISKVLEQYGDIFKKYGLYTLVILFIFGAVFGYMTQYADQEENKKTEIIIKDLNKTTDLNETEKDNIEELKKTEKLKEEATENNIDKASEGEKKEEKPVISEKVEPKAPKALAFVFPIKGEIIAKFGLKYSELYDDYRLHPGIDIKASDKEEIHAAEAGKVSLIEKTEAQMITVEIEHSNGWLTRYCHLSEAKVKQGQQVNKGDIVGLIGKPGLEEENDGYHLHFEIKQNQQWVNPEKYLQ